jgi:hypothetical protein
MISWPRDAVLAACRNYAPLVTPIAGIDTTLLLAAMAANESTVGVDCGPRYEQNWDWGGTYSKNPKQQSLLNLYGRAAAMSYGPLQIMFYNAPGCTPEELNTNLSMVMRASIEYLNNQIREFDPKTVTDVGQMWNGGHVVRPPAVPSLRVQNYCKELNENYTAATTWFGLVTVG